MKHQWIPHTAGGEYPRSVRQKVKAQPGCTVTEAKTPSSMDRIDVRSMLDNPANALRKAPKVSTLSTTSTADPAHSRGQSSVLNFLGCLAERHPVEFPWLLSSFDDRSKVE